MVILRSTTEKLFFFKANDQGSNLGEGFLFCFLLVFLISEGDSGVMLKRKKESGICPATKKIK